MRRKTDGKRMALKRSKDTNLLYYKEHPNIVKPMQVIVMEYMPKNMHAVIADEL